VYETAFHFMFMEVHNAADPYDIECNVKYVSSMAKALTTILNNQMHDGICVLKVSSTIHAPVLNILYKLSILYDEVAVFKPMASNVISFDKYIVCVGFHPPPFEDSTSVCELPYFFKVKMNEINVALGQHQLEYMNIAIDLANDVHGTKMENIKKTSIRKSSAWRDKYLGRM
jgi:hypothetical protein